MTKEQNKKIKDIINCVNDLKQSFEFLTEDSVVDICNGITTKLNSLLEDEKVDKANKELIKKNHKL